MTIYIDIDGAPVALKDVSWIEAAPCGCVCGVHVADSSFATYVDEHPITTPEAAAAAFAPNTQRLKYDQARGFTHRAELRREAVRLLQVECTHDPKYGETPLPVIDGYVWATTDEDGYGRRTYRQHLAPTGYIEAEGYDNRTPLDVLFGRASVKTVCGKTVDGAKRWSADFHDLNATVPCTRCVTKAHAATLALA